MRRIHCMHCRVEPCDRQTDGQASRLHTLVTILCILCIRCDLKWQKEDILLHATSEIRNGRNAEIGTNTARGVRAVHELFVFKLCTAVIFLIVAKFSARKQILKMPISFPLARWCHIYAQTAYMLRHRTSGFSTHCGALSTPR